MRGFIIAATPSLKILARNSRLLYLAVVKLSASPALRNAIQHAQLVEAVDDEKVRGETETAEDL